MRKTFRQTEDGFEYLQRGLIDIKEGDIFCMTEETDELVLDEQGYGMFHAKHDTNYNEDGVLTVDCNACIGTENPPESYLKSIVEKDN
jgi:hypothetical protein